MQGLIVLNETCTLFTVCHYVYMCFVKYTLLLQTFAVPNFKRTTLYSIVYCGEAPKLILLLGELVTATVEKKPE